MPSASAMSRARPRRPLHLLSRSIFSTPIVLVTALLSLAGCSSDNDDRDFARIRLLNVSAAYDSLDLSASKTGEDNDVIKFQGVGYEGLSDYSEVDSTAYDIKVKRSGVTGTLSSFIDEKQADNTHLTYVAYGVLGNFGMMKLSDDQSAAESGKTKLKVMNTTGAGTLDVYLTDESVTLDDATPQVGSVGVRSSSATVNVDSGTYRLRVVLNGDTTDVRLDIPNLTLQSKQVVALILTDTPGGVLVHGLLLPQAGQLDKHHNTKARIRGAVGIANGSSVSAGIAGTTVLTGAGVGVISNKYLQVQAGAAPVTLKVDGVTIPRDTETLTAGADYTLLVWSNAAGAQMSLVSDDNHIATSTRARLRFLNGLSASGQPTTMAVNLSPIFEGLPVGQASDYEEFDPGFEYQIDVSDTGTNTNLLTKTELTLEGSGVYTLFVSGNSTVAGTLRKDR